MAAGLVVFLLGVPILQRRLFNLTGDHLPEGPTAKLSTESEDALS